MNQKRLWAPWRIGYIAGARKGKKSGGCLFCRLGRSTREVQDFIVARGESCFCVLNRFPYNNGHLLVAPYRHVGDLGSLTEQESVELMRMCDDGIGRLRRVLAPDGYNLGLNLGRAAGAGIPKHLHLHVVPRWIGDTNFMPLLTDTRVISQSLHSAHQLLTRA